MPSSRRAPLRMAAWDRIPEDEKPFQRRLMEVFAGFTEHADDKAGRVIDEIEQHGLRDNTLDLLHLGRQRLVAPRARTARSASCWRRTASRPRSSSTSRRSNELGGLDVLGGPKTDNMYHAGWAWAGSTPYQGTKLRRLALRRHAQSDGGLAGRKRSSPTRRRVAVPSRQRHRPDDLRVSASRRRRSSTASRRIRSTASAWSTPLPIAKAPGRKTQFFEIMGSRAHLPRRLDRLGLRPAHSVGGRAPAGINEWSPDKDTWELYNLDAGLVPGQRPRRQEQPQKLAEMKELFVIEATRPTTSTRSAAASGRSGVRNGPRKTPRRSFTTREDVDAGCPNPAAPKLGTAQQPRDH